MAMTINTDGLENVSRMLTELENRAQEVASGALFDGAGIVADAFTAAARSIQTEKFKYARPGKTRLPSPEEKEALLGKSGVAKFRQNGSEVDTIIGISASAGYANVGGKKKAVRMIARSINSGTSFMKRQPVFRKAKSQSQGAAKAAIVAKAETMFDEIINSK